MAWWLLINSLHQFRPWLRKTLWILDMGSVFRKWLKTEIEQNCTKNHKLEPSVHYFYGSTIWIWNINWDACSKKFFFFFFLQENSFDRLWTSFFRLRSSLIVFLRVLSILPNLKGYEIYYWKIFRFWV